MDRVIWSSPDTERLALNLPRKGWIGSKVISLVFEGVGEIHTTSDSISTEQFSALARKSRVVLICLVLSTEYVAQKELVLNVG